MSNWSTKRKEIWKERELNNKCIYCGIECPALDRKGCSKCLSEKSLNSIKFAKENKDKSSQYRLYIKHFVIDKYGGECNCCGEKETLFLTIDHINNDGKIDRVNKKNYSSLSFYLKLKKYDKRNDIQVLCFNCNLGKSINGGVCPHKEIRRKLTDQYDKMTDPQYDLNTKIVWPSDDDLIDMCNETSVTEVSNRLGVDFSSVSGRLKRRNKYHLVIKRTGGILKGEDNKSSKLTSDEVVDIIKRYKNGEKRKDLSLMYKVSLSLIDKIVTNKLCKKSEQL